MIRITLLLSAFFFTYGGTCFSFERSEHFVENSSQKALRDTTKTYQNPVMNRNFPDPAVLMAPDGYYYAYGTNTHVQDQLIHIQMIRSVDLVHWEEPEEVMPETPSWAEKDYWAPHVLYDKDKELYYMYYSAEFKGEEYGKCLGVATSSTPGGPFTDLGTPLLCGEGFVNIDPMALDDPVTGKKLLYWGSGFGPIKVRELDDTRTRFKKGTTAVDLLQPVADDDPDNYERLVEGVWVDYREGYYYMYYSGDNCCGENAHYATMIARSRNATGPFQKFVPKEDGNTKFLIYNEKWNAPGHNSIIRDGSGQDWIIYHAIDRENPENGRMMLIDQVLYKDQWPYIPDNSPSIKMKSAPVIMN